MRLPQDFDRYKSDGRTIEIDLQDPATHQLGELDGKGGGGEAASRRFVEWLRSLDWDVSTEHRGRIRIGGKTADEDRDVFALQLALVNEFVSSGSVIH